MIRHIASIYVVLALACPASAQVASDAKSQSSADIELIRLRLERELRSEMKEEYDVLRSSITGELSAHRQYLQSLDDRFYDRIQFWIPAFSAVVALVIAVFLWYAGRTRKEAYEAIRFEAEARATELAVKKVDEIVNPEKILADVKAVLDATTAGIKEMRNAVVKDVEDELKAARNEALLNRHEAIGQALDEAIRTKFHAELDVLTRLRKVEASLTTLSNKSSKFEDAILVEQVKLAVAGSVELKQPWTIVMLRSMAEIMSSAVLKLRL